MPKEDIISIEVDKELHYSVKKFEDKIVDELSSFAVKENTIPEKPCFPTYLELAILSNAAYTDIQSSSIPTGWKVLTSAKNNSNGYVGVLYLNPDKQLLVLSHKGTESFEDYKTCFFGVISNKFHMQVHSAITFADTVNSTIAVLNNKYDNIKLLLSFTGHSLGGWLAQITAFSSKYLTKGNGQFQVIDGKDLQIHTVSFDSPGCKDMLVKLEKQCLRDRYDRIISIDSLDITCILGTPNFINCFRRHVGTIFRQCHKISNTWRLKVAWFYTLKVHEIKNFISAFGSGESGLVEVVVWPLLQIKNKQDYDNFFKIGKYENNYHPDLETLGTAGYDIRYDYKPVDWNICSMNIFSKDECNFIKLVGISRKIPNYIEPNYIEDFPHFTVVESKYSMLECGDADKLKKIIQCVKQMFRWNSNLVPDIIAKIKTLPSFHKHLLLYESKAYLSNIIQIDYEFDDFMDLESFINSDKTKVHVFHAQVHCEITTEFAISMLLKRLQCLLTREKYAILRWDSLCQLKKYLSVTDDSHFFTLADFQVIIIDFSEQLLLSDTEKTEILDSLKNIPTKLILFTKEILFTKDNFKVIDSMFQKSFHFDNSFTNRLTDSSHKKLLEEMSLNCGNSKIPLKDILLVNENEIDSVKSIVNELVQELDVKFLVNVLATSPNNAGENKSKIHVPSSIDARYVQIQSHEIVITKKDLLTNIHENKNEKSYFLITSSTRVPNDNSNPFEDVSNVTYSFRDVLEDYFEEFKNLCQKKKELYEVAYWYDHIIEKDSFNLKCIYNKKICISRNLKQRNNVKNSICKEFSRCTDYFIFAGFEKYEDIFKNDCKPNNVLMISSYEDEEITDQQLGQLKLENVHIFKKKENDDETVIVWCYSSNSLDCLREHICENQPISEETFAMERQNRIVIISDEPATGKSSVLTTLAEKLNSNLVMRVNLGNCQNAVEKFPENFNFELAVQFIVENSNVDPTQFPNGYKLLKYVLKHKTQKPVYLILDEFDEIKDFKRQGSLFEKMTKFVELILESTNNVHVWIGVRRNLRSILEDRFCVFSASLQEIAPEEQKKFIHEYWKSLALTDTIDAAETDLKENANVLVEKAVKFFSNVKKTNPIGSPLLMKLLATVFYHTESSNFQSSDFRFETLIKSFLDLKLDIYINEKLGCTFKNNDRSYIPWYKDCLIQKHEYLAVHSVFRNWHKKAFIEFQDPELNDKIEYLRIGILTAVSPTTAPRFIHQIYEEYYCATLFLKRLTTGNDKIKDDTLKFLLTVILIDQKYKTIRYFIDENLSYLLSCNDTYRTFSEWISKLWAIEPRSFFTHAKHETALHVVMKEKLDNLTTLLIKCFTCDTKGSLYTLLSSRNFEGETSLNIALNSEHKHFLDLFGEIFKSKSYPTAVYEELLLSTFFKIKSGVLKTNLDMADMYYFKDLKPTDLISIIMNNIEEKRECIKQIFDEMTKSDVKVKIDTVFYKVGSQRFRHYLARSFNEEGKHLILLANGLEIVDYLIEEYKTLLRCEIPKGKGNKLQRTVQALEKHTKLPELKKLVKNLNTSQGKGKPDKKKKL